MPQQLGTSPTGLSVPLRTVALSRGAQPNALWHSPNHRGWYRRVGPAPPTPLSRSARSRPPSRTAIGDDRTRIPRQVTSHGSRPRHRRGRGGTQRVNPCQYKGQLFSLGPLCPLWPIPLFFFCHRDHRGHREDKPQGTRRVNPCQRPLALTISTTKGMKPPAATGITIAERNERRRKKGRSRGNT